MGALRVCSTKAMLEANVTVKSKDEAAARKIAQTMAEKILASQSFARRGKSVDSSATTARDWHAGWQPSAVVAGAAAQRRDRPGVEIEHHVTRAKDRSNVAACRTDAEVPNTTSHRTGEFRNAPWPGWRRRATITRTSAILAASFRRRGLTFRSI
jgi:hypothetical protein